MEMDYVSLGKNIRKYRAIAGMTQEQLGEFAGCSDRHIGKIEKGENIPSLAVIVGIANALNVGIDRLLYGDLANRTDYFVQELAALTEGFEGKDKIMAIELTKALVAVLKELKIK
jgi:transcriptional regulator with XRE-family HTH domain